MSGRSRRGRPPHEDVLTPTEWRVVHAVQHGMSNREIAARRGISLDAVKYHVANAVAKLGLTNRQALRRWFRVPGTSALRLQERPIMSTLTLGPLARSPERSGTSRSPRPGTAGRSACRTCTPSAHWRSSTAGARG